MITVANLYMNNAIPEFIFASCFGSNLIKQGLVREQINYIFLKIKRKESVNNRE